ncbi:hypothetical protein IC617_08250 [Neiella sp. HB171785]|uniref:Uncharacterized protein n=1 Tax=Neiella litorisoli TaxID=2771431 RepID=A0A8J6ULR5_9GAMM|nr:hypothetical protein [Neiella litorisoli]MBD1389415.1 hypothetical protein [Neiella litorisoli]
MMMQPTSSTRTNSTWRDHLSAVAGITADLSKLTQAELLALLDYYSTLDVKVSHDRDYFVAAEKADTSEMDVDYQQRVAELEAEGASPQELHALRYDYPHNLRSLIEDDIYAIRDMLISQFQEKLPPFISAQIHELLLMARSYLAQLQRIKELSSDAIEETMEKLKPAIGRARGQTYPAVSYLLGDLAEVFGLPPVEPDPAFLPLYEFASELAWEYILRNRHTWH